MSKYDKQVVSTCKIVDDFLRRTGLVKYGPCYLSKRDSATYLAAVSILARVTLDLLDDGTPDCPRWMLPWLNTMVSLDVEQLGKFLKSALKFFRNYPVSERTDWVGFKHLFKESFPLVGAFMAPIKEESEHFLLAPNPHSFSIINQFLSCLTPLSLRDVDFTPKAIKDYLDNEERMANFKHDYALYDEINLIIREWFQDFHFEEFIPQHGSGSTAFTDGKSAYVKYSSLGNDQMIGYFLRRLGLRDQDIFPVPPGRLDRKCEVTFVAKNMTSCRTISMEPPVLQYLQQGVWKQLEPFLFFHPYLSRRVRIHESGQNQNRELARLGSKDGDYATIDLSSASDTVSWQMVKRLFAGTEYLVAAYATRSRCAVLPNGSLVQLQKFAPMGSALCFPTECIIFCAICEFARKKSGLPGNLTDYRVFGDDIIVRKEIFRDVVSLLIRCGFIINQDKTFFHPLNPFRESCGGEFYLNVDVTPFRISRKFSADLPNVFHPTVFENHISMANLAAIRDLRRVRHWFIQRLLTLPQMYWPRFSEDFSSVFSPSPTNYHLREIWFDWWQESLNNYGIVISKRFSEQGCASEDIRYFEWLRLSRKRKRLVYPEDLVSVHIGRQVARLASVLDLLPNTGVNPSLLELKPLQE